MCVFILCVFAFCLPDRVAKHAHKTHIHSTTTQHTHTHAISSFSIYLCWIIHGSKSVSPSCSVQRKQDGSMRSDRKFVFVRVCACVRVCVCVCLPLSVQLADLIVGSSGVLILARCVTISHITGFSFSSPLLVSLLVGPSVFLLLPLITICCICTPFHLLVAHTRDTHD